MASGGFRPTGAGLLGPADASSSIGIPPLLAVILTRTRRRRKVESIDQLTAALDTLFVETGGDVNSPMQKSSRLELLDPRWRLCDHLLLLLTDALEEIDDERLRLPGMNQTDFQDTRRQITLLQVLIGKVIVLMRNLSREDIGSTRFSELRAAQLVSTKVLRENPASARIQAASFGFLWSQILRKQQGATILQQAPLDLVFKTLDTIRFYFQDGQVVKYGVGLVQTALACALEFFSSAVSSRLGSIRVRILEIFQALLGSDRRVASVDLTEQLVALASKFSAILITEDTRSDVSLVLPLFYLSSVTQYGKHLKPKSLEVCVSFLNNAMDSSPEGFINRIRTQLAGYLDSLPSANDEDTSSQVLRDSVVRLLIKCARPTRVVMQSPSSRGSQGSLIQSFPRTAEAVCVALDPRSRLALVASQNTTSPAGILSLYETFPSARLLWRLNSGSAVAVIRDVTSLCFSTNSAFCAVGTAHGDVFVLETRSGAIVKRLLLRADAPPDTIWFVSFVDTSSSAILYGQAGIAHLWDLATNEPEEVCEAHRLSTVAYPGSGMFISTFHQLQDGGDHFDHSDTRVFKLERSLENRQMEMTFCQDLLPHQNQQGQQVQGILWHGIGVSTRWALTCPTRISEETPLMMWELRHGIPLRRIVSSVFINDGSEIESCHISTNGQRCLLVSDTTGEVVLLDLSTLSIIARRDFNQAVRCECLSADGSLAMFQLESEEGETESDVFAWDFFAEDRRKMLQMSKLIQRPTVEGKGLPVEILRRVKGFLY